MKLKTKAIALIGILSTLAISLNILEALFIPQMVPGMKIGLANLVTVLSVFLLKKRYVFFIMFVRIIVSSLLLGTFLSIPFFFTLSGALLSTVITILLYSFDKNISPVFLSISGAITHNIGQLCVAYLFLGYGMAYYLPYLILFAIPTGFITGKIVAKLLNYRNRIPIST